MSGPVAAGLLALGLATVVIAATLRPLGWDVTALPQVGTHTKLGVIAKRIDHGFRTADYGGYDGQFNWAIALDPLALGHEHNATDRPEYRYGRPLLGWLGWVASGGSARSAAAALLAVGLASLAAAAAMSALLARRLQMSLAASVAVCCNPGLLFASAHSLSEPLAVALLLGALWAFAARRRSLALALLVFLPLAREQLVLASLAIALVAFFRWPAGRREALLVLGTILPSVVWWIYLRIHLDGWLTTGSSALGTPLAGWRRAILDAGVGSAATDPQALVVYVALLGVLAAVGVVALLRRNVFAVIFVLLGALVLCLAPNATVRLQDALRNTSILLALAPFVFSRRDIEEAFARPVDRPGQ